MKNGGRFPPFFFCVVVAWTSYWEVTVCFRWRIASVRLRHNGP